MPELSQVIIDNEKFFRISDSDQLRPFFMSIVSESDHWMFVASNGGLSAGRKSAEYALFPYYTDDKITEFAEVTGCKSIFRVLKGGKVHIWEPFSIRGAGHFQVSRNLYKHAYGHKIIFEEVNHDLELRFRYGWSSSDVFGFVRHASLFNQSKQALDIQILDGLQNIVPASISSDLQNFYSNLVDAYKRSELHTDSGLGIFALSAILSDKAEPSEALKANVVWSLGLEKPKYLLSSRQLTAFRDTGQIQSENDVKGEKGAYLVQKDITLAPGESQRWFMVANLNQNHTDVVGLIHRISHETGLGEIVQKDIDQGTRRLAALNAAADGLQCTADELRDTRHFSNVLFNIMRGGIFDSNYQIEKWDFSGYLEKANKEVYALHTDFLEKLPEKFTVQELRQRLAAVEDTHLQRLCTEYLPLRFSRRHGDPSRPWNRFSINTRKEDGSKILDYEGNWRDIFQNWEALAYAYPDFIEGMIAKFLNASTFDGYNPYRVTKGGFDWEVIEPDDPWSFIGYWGDHQIIYLLKFLEFLEKHHPGRLSEYFQQSIFAYANVPYRIKPYADIQRNPKDTIDFDHAADSAIRQRREKMGADGALLTNRAGHIHQVNFLEKILATVLAKLSNFIPEGGIWMNTQRPEWNDANNALVGNGVSMVTLYYLRRFLSFFGKVLAQSPSDTFPVSAELVSCYEHIRDAFEQHKGVLKGAISDRDRKAIMDALGNAGGDYRSEIYAGSFSGQTRSVDRRDLIQCFNTSLDFLDHTIAANRRTDNLYHAYNLMTIHDNGVSLDYLSEMLEGQVAVLSSGYLAPDDVLAVLDAMKASRLFRSDQYSYLLYPNKELPGFLNKNNIPPESVAASKLLQQMVADGNKTIIERDIEGGYHFNGSFKNANDLDSALKTLEGTVYAGLAGQERLQILGIFEQVFHHKSFTGRSGTFYGYEGLGSIYWHMVSKLLLAVNEYCANASETAASTETFHRVLEHYYEINAGIGVHKPPGLYGAFPTDPYSHTPAGKGAQQPGMTGQVKEDILSRFGELGAGVSNGKLYFRPNLLKRAEFLSEGRTFHYFNIEGKTQEIELAANSLAFTYCQVPVIYQMSEAAGLTIHFRDGKQISNREPELDANTSQSLFCRSGDILRIEVSVPAHCLK
ncbi:MAG: hypothetical protein R3D00_05105 [Bacteroidia bacterium]